MTAAAPRPPRVVLWGTCDLGKPRTRILVEGLRAQGVEVIEIVAHVWEGVEDKSVLPRRARALRLARMAAAWPALAARYARAPAHDAVLVGYMGQFDVLPAALLARLRGARLAWDMFLSLHDAVAHDRALARPRSAAGRLLRALERAGARLADVVFVDTAAHARRIEGLLDLPPGALAHVPVGAEPAAFPRLPPPPPPAARRLRLLFYGQMIPLHGVETILRAALSERGAAHDWTLIGRGQQEGLVREALARAGARAAHVRWREWVPYRELIAQMRRADICLGVFGGSGKAGCVTPNKVHQALAAGRPVVTRDGPALRELAAAIGPEPGLEAAAPEDPEALLDAIDRLAARGLPQPSERAARVFSPEAIGAHAARLILPRAPRAREREDQTQSARP
ncbi:glycosyltransferase [Oceanicella actignis]|uniref:Glycosyltransferase involved in cell wall bisynthesis n=1 Tax=Oceanicella actignis TaxID=1189325 RepID=A0A1M7S1L1_9RHOB|nr:glycosyltransferase [Oceanicella actignis]SES92042.1 Glycosyltransferase involved in cell wall bisynthesis [Oceanicella actignis]SHN52300.1 Glycosyltransferase involved in cell wall bisynthesis [Oceanicella actignis]